MPGKSGAPAFSRVTRLSRSSCLTDLLLYPLARSSPTVPGLVTRTLCRAGSGLSIASLARREEIAQQEDAQLNEQELVPGRGCLERVPRVAELVFEDAGERALGQAHCSHHEFGWDLAAGAVLAMAV